MMSTTVKRLLKENRDPEEPVLHVPAGPKQVALLKSLKQQIDKDLASAEMPTWDKREVLILEPKVPGDREKRYSWSYYHSLRVRFEGEELQLGPGHGEEAVPCAGIEQILRTLTAMQERLIDESRRAQKSAKLKKLKEKAIEVQVEAVAERMQFEFALQSMHAKSKLYVALDEKEAIVVDVPHGRFQEVLAELPDLVKAVRAIHARGYRYSITFRDRYHGYRKPGPA